MSHGDRAKWKGNWNLDRCYMGNRPGNETFGAASRPPNKRKTISTKTLTHRAERRQAQRALRKELQ